MIQTRIPPLAPFEQSPHTRVLADYLRDVPEGEVATYEALSAMLGWDVRESWHLINSAQDMLLKEGAVFGVVANVGLKRLDDVGKVAKAEGYLEKGRNAARRTVKVLQKTEYAALPPEEQTRFMVAELRAGSVLLFGSKSASNRLKEAASAGVTVKQLKASVKDTLKQFGA